MSKESISHPDGGPSATSLHEAVAERNRQFIEMGLPPGASVKQIKEWAEARSMDKQHLRIEALRAASRVVAGYSAEMLSDWPKDDGWADEFERHIELEAIFLAEQFYRWLETGSGDGS